MKLTKEQIQKAVLVGMLGIGGLYYYAFEMLGPLADRETKANKEIAGLEPKIKEAKSKIARTKAIEAGDINAENARQMYALMKTRIPDSQPVAWLPTRLSEFFKREGIPKQSFRSNPMPMAQSFPGYKDSSWIIELPGVGFASLGGTVADLENQEGLVQITGLQVDAVGKDPERHPAQLTISTLVKSEK